MRKLSEDLKNGIIKQVYLLYGDQKYLVNQYRDRIVNKILGEDNRLNYACYSGKNIPVPEIIDLSETMPFLGERRVIVIENSGFFESGCEQLEEYIASVPDTTTIIFAENSAKKNLKMYKAVAKYGTVVCFNEVPMVDLKTWVRNKIITEHKQMSESVIHAFIERTGPDLLNMSMELDKLLAYTYGRESITINDINAICTVRIEEHVFVLMEAILGKRRDEAMKSYAEIVALQRDPMSTLGFVNGQIRLILNCKLFLEDHVSDSEHVAQVLGVKPYAAQKALMQARKSSKIWLENSLNYCIGLDADVKSGRMDKTIALESAITYLLDTIS